MSKREPVRRRLPLCAASIDEISQSVAEVLADIQIERKRRTQICLSLEEILLRWMQNGSDAQEVVYLIERRFGKLEIFIRLKGEPVDPLDEDAFAEASLGRDFLASLGQGWAYQYAGGVNQASLSISRPSRIGPAGTMGLSICGAVLVGLLLRQAPPAFGALLLEGLLTPLFLTFLRFLSAVVGPMMFLSVAWGICGLGAPAALGRMGKRLFGRWIFHLGLTLLLTAALCIVFFPLEQSASGASQAQFGTIFTMFLEIVPGDFVSPFAQGNTLQILFLAVVIGGVVCLLKRRVPVIAQLLEQANEVMRQLLAVLSRLIPGFIFLSTLRIVLTGSADTFTGVSGFVAVILCATSIVVVACLASIPLLERISPWPVLRQILPSVLVSFATASSSAAFPLMQESCCGKLGIDKKLVDFALPLGIVIFKPSNTIEFLAMSVFCSSVYGVPMAAENLVVAAVVALLLSIAAPPVPGGMLTCFTLLFTQLGIPLEALVIAGALDMLLDFPLTALNMLAIQVQLLHGAERLGMIDKKVLSSISGSENRNVRSEDT